MTDSVIQYEAFLELMDTRGSTFWGEKERKKKQEMAALKPCK